MNNDAVKIIKVLAKLNYFADNSYDPTKFITIVENQLNIDRNSAIKILTDEKLAVFEYSHDKSIHPKDIIDYWRLSLTKKGKSIIKT